MVVPAPQVEKNTLLGNSGRVTKKGEIRTIYYTNARSLTKKWMN